MGKLVFKTCPSLRPITPSPTRFINKLKECAKKHFEVINVDYKPITSISELI